MTFPNIPNVTPTISITEEQVVNLLLASIAFEELGLAHIINAEGEKIQYVISHTPTMQQLLEINRSVERTLRSVLKKEMLLQFKLEDVVNIPVVPGPPPTQPPVETSCITITRKFFNPGGAPPDFIGTLVVTGTVGGPVPPESVIVELLDANGQVLRTQVVTVTGNQWQANFVIPSAVFQQTAFVRATGVNSTCSVTTPLQCAP